MSTREIDDRSSEVVYSRPNSGHHWSPIGSSDSYGQTVTLTRTRGATARITFEGTRIQVMGLVSPAGTGGTPVSSYGLDNRPSVLFTTTQEANTRARVVFYDSGEIDAGQHTLIVTDEAEGPFFWIDSFIITSNPEPPPDPPSQPAPVSNPPSVETTPAQDNVPAPVTSDGVDSPVSSPTPRAVDPSTRSQASTASQGEPSDSAWEGVKIIVTTKGSSTSNGQSSPQITGAGDVSARSGDGLNVGAIVGGVLGGVIIILLFTLLFFVWKRKRNPHGLSLQQNAVSYTSSLNASSVHPFNTALTPSVGSPVDPPSEKSQYGTGGPASHPMAGHAHRPNQLSYTSAGETTSGWNSHSGYASVSLDAGPPTYQQAQSLDLNASGTSARRSNATSPVP